MNLYQKHFRTLSWTVFKINKIFPSYRQGFNTITKKMETFKPNGDGWWMEKYWDWQKYAERPWKVDMKLHKKVYDVEIELEKEKEFEFKDSVKSWRVVTITLSAFMIWEIMKATVAFGKDIPQNNGRDAFDWEESFLKDMKDLYVVFSVSGEGIWTRYTFKEAKPFSQTEAILNKETPKRDIDEKWVAEVEAILGNKDETKDELDELF